ncbi:hypothetical protein HNP46_004211 [Pseudomonas nitritireducens]|uniref:Uncharacterized protein n=1 Tax=Pseudomonas nitroreducens TaxID=46680 RepID=A0A7W7KM32_PSENT|nr:hypothetical protein [Pseudomonas nitritireducens]MBB4865330.1 hypothetical protein [Pseudomonas nitritireducens]
MATGYARTHLRKTAEIGKSLGFVAVLPVLTLLTLFLPTLCQAVVTYFEQRTMQGAQ